MAEQPTDSKPAVKVDDPYDLGDTDLYPRWEVQPYTKPVPAEEGAVPAPEPESAAARPAPLKDPETGRFIKAPEPTEPASPGANAPPAHPAWVLQQAESLGLDAEDLAQPTTYVAKQITRLLRQQQQFREEQSRASLLQEGQVRPLSGEGTPPVSSDDALPGEEDIAPSIVAILKGQAKQIRELQAQLGQVKTHVEQREHETQSQWIDRLIGQHGEKSVFGDGPIRNLKPNSPEVFRRQAVVDAARKLAGDKAGPRDWIPRIPEALTQLFGAKPTPPPAVAAEPAKPAKNGKPRITPEEWQEGVLARPTHRAGAAEPNGEAKAVANLTAKMGEAGLLSGAEDAEIMDTLL